MPIPKLVPSSGTVDIQNTSFSIDALGRYICNTWEEATDNSGPEFDAIVIGAGMYGAYCASKIYRLNSSKRVLVLDAGSFLVSEHVQNLTRMGLDVPGAIAPVNDPGTARNLVWGMPWRGNVDFPGLAYCVGGKSIYWGGWCPRLTPSDLQNWPTNTAQYLNTHYSDIEQEIGVTPKTDFISGVLFDVLKQRFIDVAPTIQNIDLSLGNNGIEDAPLAVQGESPAPGLFSFDKYSSASVLINAIREDAANAQGNDANRQLFLVPKAHALKLHTEGNRVNSLEVSVDGQRRSLAITDNCSVILASSTIETTRLALASFPTPLMGRNLMAHVRSDFTVRIRRSALPALPTDVETAAFMVRGTATSGGQFHVQVTASANTTGSDALLFRMIPDLDFLQEQLANDDPDWITITLRGVGETHGDRNTSIPNSGGSWLNLSPYEYDEFGIPRAYVNFKINNSDLQTWQEMDKACVDLVQAIVNNQADIQYFYNDNWQTTPFSLDTPFPEWHRGLGTTYHEAGTLWMGQDSNSSVTNELGRFHHISNAYACDQSIFPTVGSANPTPTGLSLARQLAEHIVSL